LFFSPFIFLVIDVPHCSRLGLLKWGRLRLFLNPFKLRGSCRSYGTSYWCFSLPCPPPIFVYHRFFFISTTRQLPLFLIYFRRGDAILPWQSLRPIQQGHVSAYTGFFCLPSKVVIFFISGTLLPFTGLFNSSSPLLPVTYRQRCRVWGVLAVHLSRILHGLIFPGPRRPTHPLVRPIRFPCLPEVAGGLGMALIPCSFFQLHGL